MFEKGKQHTEETRRKMHEAAPEKKVRGWAWIGRKHTEETRRKMREAARRKREQGMGENAGYRMLIAAIVRQAIKDGAAWFFETETGKGCCAVAGIEPAAPEYKTAWREKCRC